MSRSTPAGLTALGMQRLSLTNSTALGLNTTCIQGTVFHISVETNSVRLRTDATAPTLTTGVLLATGLTWLFDVPGDNLKLQRSTGSAVVNIAAYKY